MEWTQADQEILRAAMRKGVQEVTYSNGMRVRYHSMQEMIALDERMSADIAARASTSGRHSRAAFSKD